MTAARRRPANISENDWAEVDSPALTKDQLMKMRPAHEIVPEIVETYRRTRGKQKAPTKQLTSIRFDLEILMAFRTTGVGWQKRINAALAQWLKRHDPKDLNV